MLPEATGSISGNQATLEKGWEARLPQAWRAPLFQLAVMIAALVVVTMREWGEMAHQWFNIDTYNHIVLVPFIAGWLVWLKAPELVKVTPRPLAFGLCLVQTCRFSKPLKIEA